MDQGSTMKRSAVHNFAPTVTKFCVMWEGQALPHDTKFGNSRCEIVGRRVIFIWSLIHGLRWSGLIKAEPGQNGRHFADDIFQMYFSWIKKFDLIQISQKFASRDPIDKLALVQVMAWHIYITRHQWVNAIELGLFYIGPLIWKVSWSWIQHTNL